MATSVATAAAGGAVSAAAAGAPPRWSTPCPPAALSRPAINHIPGTDRNNGRYGDVHRHPGYDE